MSVRRSGVKVRRKRRRQCNIERDIEIKMTRITRKRKETKRDE